MSNTYQTIMVEMKEMLEKPVFQVWSGDKHYKIWANGSTEGFGVKFGIRNDIPLVLTEVIKRTLHSANHKTEESPNTNIRPSGEGLSHREPE